MDPSNAQVGIQTRKILFVTNAESGQANTVLALALEASLRPSVEVHVASFPILKHRVEKLSPKLNFHSLDGDHMFEVFSKQGFLERDMSSPPTTKSFVPYEDMSRGLTVWDGESYMRVCDSVKKTIEALNPDTIVVDFLLNPAFDACCSLNREFVISSPNTPLDMTKMDQPWLKRIWYPMVGTGISYPMRWRDVIPNIIARIMIRRKMSGSVEVGKLESHRSARGFPKGLPIFWVHTKATHIICPGVREVDLPLFKIPDNLGLYGPVVLDTTSVEVSGPELNQWLSRGETVLMCMGTHFHYSESQVKAVIKGFLGAVTPSSNTQLLWKLADKSKFEGVIEEALKDPSDKERFRIVDWLEADPMSILEHPNVVVWIHHGGANSYFEGALAGIPQIILAQWLDLYDMAVRAEYVGIGIYGNKKFAPDIQAVEFEGAVSRLLRPGEELDGFRMRAKTVAEACRKGGGKKRAVDKILEITDGK